MQEVKIEITVQYRDDGKAVKGKVYEELCDLLLTVDRAKLFSNIPTYAGYSIAHALREVKPIQKISKSDLNGSVV
jgi:hypothetical protein